MQEALLRTVQLDTTSQPEVAAFHTIFPPADLFAFLFSFRQPHLKCSSNGNTIPAQMHLYDLFGQPRRKRNS